MATNKTQNLTINCDSVNIETRHGTSDIILEIIKPDLSFLGNIEIEELVKGWDSKLLFEAIIENDEDILHDYLISHGYIFNKN